MWWIIGLVIAGIYGIAQTILDSLREEVAVERQRWENSYQHVEREVQQQQRIIEQKLSTANAQLQYQEIANLHAASIKVADTTYELLKGARKTLAAMGRAIVEAAKQRKALENKKRQVIFGQGQLEKQIQALHRLRDQILIPDKDKVKAQRDRLLREVNRLNQQTAKLRDLKNQIRQQNSLGSGKKTQWHTGQVIWFDERKGFGFIKLSNGNQEIYVNIKQLRNTKTLRKDDHVRFEIRGTGKPWAANVSKL